MKDNIAEVLAGNRRWAVVQSDVIEFLSSLPDDSVDLLFTSPPYEKAREYGELKFNLSGQAWVDWMVRVVEAAAPKVKGLIAVNCEGQTKDYRYSCTPFLLIADLHRKGFHLRKPVVYRRNGIPGSGGPDWLRNDWEPVICATRPGRLAWSDTVACGKPPIFGPGGPMSNRTKSGYRVPGNKRRPDGSRRTDSVEFSKRVLSGYTLPDIANPGNVVECGNAAHLGHALAHENEAPFPLKLPEFFVKSFCPPDGVTCDPFSGSGTTLQAAVENRRRFIGCDLRESQVKLSARRIATVTPVLFTDAEDSL